MGKGIKSSIPGWWGYMMAESHFVRENLLVRSCRDDCLAPEVPMASALLFCMVEQSRTVPESPG